MGIDPPPYFKKGMAGGHISVILAAEKRGQTPKLSQKFSFRISQQTPLTGKKNSPCSFGCPELEQVRLEQGLSLRLGSDHDFHIT